MARYDTWRDKVLMSVIYLMLIGVTFIMLYPFWDQLVLSLSTRAQALQGGIRLLPSPVTWDAYREVLDSPELWKAARNTALRVIGGTLFGVYITALTAYPLARDEFPLRRFWTILIVFTMLFSGGLIPNYLLRKDLNLLDNPLVLILPGLSAFNVIILRNFFRSIPRDLTEAAQLDGASDWQIWRQIVMPLSKPVLATIGLFIAVQHWNAYFDALIYITDPDLTVLQVVLRRVLLEDQLALMMGAGAVTIAEQQRPTPETVKAALVMVTTVPILLIYPFLQRYFIQGTLLGSVKE